MYTSIIVFFALSIRLEVLQVQYLQYKRVRLYYFLVIPKKTLGEKHEKYVIQSFVSL